MRVLTALLLVASASASQHQHQHRRNHHNILGLGQRDDGCPVGAVQTTYLSTITFSPTASPVSAVAAADASTYDAAENSTTTVTVMATSTTTKHITVTPVSTGASVPPEAPPPPPPPPPAIESPSIPPVAPPPAVTSAPPVNPPSSTIEASPAATAAVININNPVISDDESDVRATYYTEDGIGQGHCSFTGYTLPAGIFGTALSVQSWDDASQCGSCVEVTNPTSGAKVKAMIVDSCPGCPSGGLDLFESTFSQIESTAAGYLPVDWQLVDCGLSTPVQVSFKDGSSVDWFSLQVRNHNKPIGKVEICATGGGDGDGSWQALSRTEDNYFPKAGGVGGASSTNTVDIRVTDVTGKSIVFENVSVEAGAAFASSNF